MPCGAQVVRVDRNRKVARVQAIGRGATVTTRITGGSHRGRMLRVPKGILVRPTTERVRGAIFSVLGRDAVAGERVLDLFAGTGALGIEALSREASGADFVEADRRLVQRLRENLSLLNLGHRCNVHRTRVERALGALEGPYGLVFADPPYGTVDLAALLRSLDEHDLVGNHGRVVIEHTAADALPGSCGRLLRIDERRYGDTFISIYATGGVVGKGDLPG